MVTSLNKIQAIIVQGYKDAVAQFPVASLIEHRVLKKFHEAIVTSINQRKSELSLLAKAQGLPSDDVAMQKFLKTVNTQIWEFLTYKNIELTLFSFSKEAERFALEATASMRQ